MSPPPASMLALATTAEAEDIAQLLNAVAADLTTRHGQGWWSRLCTPRGVLFEMRMSKIYAYRRRGKLLAAFPLSTRKPWAIDTAYFTPVGRALYLHSVAVLPAHQGKGIGSRCLKAAESFARDWPAQAIRVDAFDHAAGAGKFYSQRGFREVGRVIYREVPVICFERLLTPPPATRERRPSD